MKVLQDSPLLSQPIMAIVVDVVVFVAFVLIVGPVIIDFRNYHRQDRPVVSGDRSLVETGSMTAFFIVYYLVIKLRLFELDPSQTTTVIALAVGLVLLVVGVGFNISGRLYLKSNWANQIKIYKGHNLTTSGPFSVVRHPLYASLIWIFIGGSLIYCNPLSLVLTLGIFVPMMYVRAKKEDVLLRENFTDTFEEYASTTGMFFPKVRR